MMVPLDHRAIEVTFTRRAICVELTDGRQVSAPLEWFPALECASGDARDTWEISDDGNILAWPSLRERISVPFLLSLRAGTSVSTSDLDLFGGVKS